MIIDIHGHYTTAPKSLEAWRNRQIAGIADPAAKPRVAELQITDDEIRETIETNQLARMRERGSDLTVFSPRASFMAHHIGDFEVSATWAAICNELCLRVSRLFPAHFIPAAMLPQSPGVDPKTCLPELVRCVEQYGNVAINLNPDPSGGHWREPPLADRHWYPIYEKMVEYDIPAMIHVSTSCNACFHTTGAHWRPVGLKPQADQLANRAKAEGRILIRERLGNAQDTVFDEGQPIGAAQTYLCAALQRNGQPVQSLQPPPDAGRLQEQHANGREVTGLDPQPKPRPQPRIAPQRRRSFEKSEIRSQMDRIVVVGHHVACQSRGGTGRSKQVWLTRKMRKDWTQHRSPNPRGFGQV